MGKMRSRSWNHWSEVTRRVGGVQPGPEHKDTCPPPSAAAGRGRERCGEQSGGKSGKERVGEKNTCFITEAMLKSAFQEHGCKWQSGVGPCWLDPYSALGDERRCVRGVNGFLLFWASLEGPVWRTDKSRVDGNTSCAWSIRVSERNILVGSKTGS